MKPHFWLSVAFLMSRIGLIEAAGQCREGDISVYGMFVKGHTFKTVQAGNPAICMMRCEEEVRCQSYNFVIGQNICELNDITREARPEDFIPDDQRLYMRRTFNRDSWQKINTYPVCFGARNNSYGAFNMTKTGQVKTMKLVHRSGSISCNTVYGDSYWGCDNLNHYGSEDVMTIITNTKREAILPPAKNLKSFRSHICGKKHFYTLERIEQKSPELVFGNLTSLMPLSQGQELQIWYGQDFADCGESDNSGHTCVDVYAWYI